ncbi:LLM class flavin-dependent oxidoreductase [Solwaraspora sp. WMMD1047]|uniref:LLM class flavin-dependent oxidoreductase n=1 Tax=Solwaraspora sp. WMMD1047 TaxID=3016102 RepID=UPI0024165958|nr:LLM class flavin-dependent oxidoreductase [Solwaraspora sp. WMMD1047]MDG4829813.1 LLM class flavin-dependent oxidoreductase [Solwaraspora sp. WMMD1047]
MADTRQPAPGHPVLVGILLPPGDPAEAVELAVASERLGYDLVIVSDDAGTGDDGTGADSWATLAWIAARTERIGLVAAGLDVTLRPPAVLARAAASLDLLAGGRVTLALRPTAGAADAVAVLRGLWDTAARRAYHPGSHHRLAGAEPGPAPAHDLAVWFGGADPAGVEVAGKLADGWLGALDPAAPEELAGQLKLLDEAATRAGRDPRELRRAVTVSGVRAQPADLAAVVTEHAVGALILRLDGTAPRRQQLDEFPAGLPQAIRQALPAAPRPRPMRRADVRAKRRAGIDYDGLPASLADTAVEPGDLGYGRARATYLRGGAPGLVLRPRTVGEVVDAVAFARRHPHLPLGVRSGGHGVSGRSTNDGGLVIDLVALDRIEILDEASRLVRIGPGARWKQVATALAPYGWALSSGDYGGVGVGGLATAGGIGFLARKHGLTIDHLRAVELVLADGSLVRATERDNAELFWAVRGAGANFGIAVAFEFVVDEVADVGWAQLAFQVADPAAFLVDFGRAVTAAPRETTPFLLMGPTAGRGETVAQVMAMVASDDPAEVVAQLQPFAELAPLVQQQVVIVGYAAVMNMFPDTPHAGRGEPVARSGLAAALTPQLAAASADLLASGAVHFFQIRSLGGATTDVGHDAMAYSHRDAGFQLTALGGNDQRLDRQWAPLRPYLIGSYLSFETGTGPDRLAEAFPPATLARLRRLKIELDPGNLFRDNFNLTPDRAPTRRQP